MLRICVLSCMLNIASDSSNFQVCLNFFIFRFFFQKNKTHREYRFSMGDRDI